MKFQLDPFKAPCGCGIPHTVSVEEIVLESDALLALPGWVEKREFHQPVMLCDHNTRAAAGDRLLALFDRPVEVVCLDPQGLHADEKAVALAESQLPEADLLLAVGSGTIHDITRYLAAKMGIPFVSVPTAASVDGFVSTVAAMTWYGYKKTLPAVAPIAVFADSRILAAAPRRLTASGFADLLGKIAALADWRASHLVTGEPVCDRICQMEEDAMDAVCRQLSGIGAGDPDACEALMYGLLLSGLAMQMMGNSRPASGAEHHFSHLWEMEVINPHVDALHGEKVGVGLVLALEYYHRLADDLSAGVGLSGYDGVEKELLDRFEAPDVRRQVEEENTPDPLAAVDRKKLLAVREELAALLHALPTGEEAAGMLRQAGAPVAMADIGLDEGLAGLSARLSPYVRARLTVMRLAKLWDFPLA